jgi:hypothetical protein
VHVSSAHECVVATHCMTDAATANATATANSCTAHTPALNQAAVRWQREPHCDPLALAVCRSQLSQWWVCIACIGTHTVLCLPVQRPTCNATWRRSTRKGLQTASCLATSVTANTLVGRPDISKGTRVGATSMAGAWQGWRAGALGTPSSGCACHACTSTTLPAVAAGAMIPQTQRPRSSSPLRGRWTGI